MERGRGKMKRLLGNFFLPAPAHTVIFTLFKLEERLDRKKWRIGLSKKSDLVLFFMKYAELSNVFLLLLFLLLYCYSSLLAMKKWVSGEFEFNNIKNIN